MKTVKLGDVCLKITDGSHYSPKPSDITVFPYVTVRDISNDQIDFDGCKRIDKRQFEDLVNNGCMPSKGDLLFSKDGTVGKVSLVNFDKDFVVLSSLAILRPNQNVILPEYLFHILKSPLFLEQAIGKKSGTAIRRIILRDLKNIEFNIEEDINEQRRVVERLDAAFEKIDRAIELTEKNIKNAWHLFDSFRARQFENGDRTKKLGEVMVLQRGYDLPKTQRTQGEYSLVSSSGIIDNINDFKVRGPGICTGRSGSVGATFYVENDFWPLNTTLYVKDYQNNDPRYCYWLLYGLDLKQFAGGTGVPTLNRNIVHEHMVKISRTELQKEIATVLDAEYSRCQDLCAKYQDKLRHLKALKQSLLTQAFSQGEVE